MDKKTTKRRSAADQDKIVVEALRGVGRPVSAYELIEALRDQGVTAPPTVYDPWSRQVMLLYRTADGRLAAGRVNESAILATTILDSAQIYATAGVKTALCADPTNTGWIAAWSPPAAARMYGSMPPISASTCPTGNPS